MSIFVSKTCRTRPCVFSVNWKFQTKLYGRQSPLPIEKLAEPSSQNSVQRTNSALISQSVDGSLCEGNLSGFEPKEYFL